MKYVDIAFGDYRPDFSGMPYPAEPGYLVESAGVRPTPNGLKPIPLFTDSGVAVSAGTTYGRIYATDYDGAISVFACTATTGSPVDARIHQSNDHGATWTDIEENVSLLVAPGLWADFCRFDEFVLATSKAADGIHVKDLSDIFILDRLAEVGDAPSEALTIARVRDSVVIGNVGAEADTVRDRAKVVWSAIGAYDDWPTPGTAEARAKQAGEQYLPLELGQITKIVGGEKFGLIFQQRGITRMTYVGGSAVFEFDTFEKKRGTGIVEKDVTGTTIPHPVVDLGGNRWAWVNSNTGLYVTDGYAVRRISLGRFDRDFNRSGAANRSAAFDSVNNLALFIYEGNSSRYPLYNPDTDQITWAIDSSIRSICEQPQTTTQPGLLNLNSSLVLQQQLSSTQQTVALQTGFIELDPGYRVQIQKVHLLGADVPGSLTISYKSAATLDSVDSSSAGFTAMTAVSRGEGASARVDAPYVAFRVTGGGSSAGYQTLRGLRVYYERTTPL